MGPVVVGEPPPAVELPEREVHPPQAAQVFERDQLSRRGEQPAAMPQGLLEISGRVQDVGGEQEVVAVGREALLHGILFDVQRTILDAPAPIPEAGLRLGEEARRDVGVHVVEPSLGQQRQHRGRGRTRARPHLDHPQAASFGQGIDELPNRLLEQPVRRARHGCLEVEIRGGRFSAAEQQGERVLAAAQHLGEGAARPPEESHLGQAVGISPGHGGGVRVRLGRQDRRPRILRSQRDDEVGVPLDEDARLGQHLKHSPEETRVLRDDAELFPQLLGVHGRAPAPAPSQRVQGRERIGPRPVLEIGQQRVPVIRIDSRIDQMFREPPRVRFHGSRAGEEVRGRHSRWKGALPPHDLVEQVLDPLDGRKQRVARRPLHRVAAQSTERNPVPVVDAQLPGQHLGRFVRVRLRRDGPLAQAHVAYDLVGQTPRRQPEPFPAEGQVGDRAVRSGQIARRAHDLKAAVQDQRMHVQSVPAQAFGEGHFAQRLPRAGPGPAQRAEGGTEINPGSGPVR